IPAVGARRRRSSARTARPGGVRRHDQDHRQRARAQSGRGGGDEAMAEHDLTGKRALVTGGASGIGLACAHEFSRRGAHVIIADVNTDAAAAAASEIGGEPWAVDLADTTALDDLALDVDILVNNAGVQRVTPLPEFDPEAFRLILRLMVE